MLRSFYRKFSLLAVALLLLPMLLSACDSGTPATPTITQATATTVAVLPATSTSLDSDFVTNTSAPAPAATDTAAPSTDDTPVATGTDTPEAGPTAPAAAGATNEPGLGAGIQRPVFVFAQYPTDYAVNVKPSLAEYTTKPDLSNVANPAEFKLPAQAQTLLAQNSFVVVPPVTANREQYNGLKEFYQVYEAGRYGQEPTFVSSDSMLHVYHLIFDKLLRDLERSKLTEAITRYNDAMLRVAVAQHAEVLKLNDSDLTAASEMLVGYFAVADKLINPSAVVPDVVKARVDEELAKIEAHAGVSKSSIFAPQDYEEDYSQYIPRGHYTKSEQLQRYFRTMIWLGRMTFRLRENNETQAALLLVRLMSSENTLRSGPILDQWKQVYEPTSFLVGKADDLSYFDYQPVMAAVYGTASPTLQQIADKDDLTKFIKATDTLPPPKVNSMFVYARENKEDAIKGLRVMGQRFTLDAYIIGQLTWRNVGTSTEQARWLPRALDVPAAFGSDRAVYHVTGGAQLDYGQGTGPEAKNYDTQMRKVRSEIGGLETSDWTQNVYWSWLYTLKPLIEAAPEGYPSFMRNNAWLDNQLNTFLGSYTELKHDTILYAKQSMAEMGGGPNDIIKGYVEPQPELYARLAALTRMTRDGLVQRGLLSDDDRIKAQLDRLLDLSVQLKTISEKELRNEPLTEDEYNAILFYGGTIENFTLASADTDEGEGTSYFDSINAALVADIATGSGTVLEVAIGHPNEIYVVAPIEGKLTLTRGAVFSQYEFTKADSERMTDEQWQQQVDAGNAPAPQDFTKSFLAPAK